jgi:antitoxin PrlF
MSITLTVTAKGQVTLRKRVLDHLGIGPGDKLEVELLPARRMVARAKAGAPASTIFGMMKREGEKAASIAEINEAAAAGWAGDR